jgi:hypothetical protein
VTWALNLPVTWALNLRSRWQNKAFYEAGSCQEMSSG